MLKKAPMAIGRRLKNESSGVFWGGRVLPGVGWVIEYS
jgi:hypothetical protein